MRKPDSLKTLLLATVPGLDKSPERLALFIDRGQIVGGNGRSLSFEYRYTLNLVVESFTGSLDMLMVPILAWIAEHQPELLGVPGAQPFTYEAEILDEESQDISVMIALREPVIVTPKDGGGYAVSHPVQPPPQSLDHFEGVPSGARLWQLFLGEALLLEGPAGG